MRITESRSRLVASESPVAIWAFGLGFVASGLFVLTAPLWFGDWSAIGGWLQLGIAAIGLGHLAGGLYTIAHARATRVEFDRERDRGTICVRRFWQRRGTLATFHPSRARLIELAASKDSDGDPVYRLRLWLAGGEHVWLQAEAAHGEAYLRSRAERIARFLEIEPPRLGLEDGHASRSIGRSARVDPRRAADQTGSGSRER